MKLPSDFLFSQSNLQDYADCPRRFYLRQVRRLAWPALLAEPALKHERHLQQGTDFHRLVHQQALGLPQEGLTRTAVGEDLRRWWRNYLEKSPSDLPQRRYYELALSAPLSGHRLVAKYDLIAVEPGKRVVMVDWKTYRKRPSRDWLAERLQTRLYPYLLLRAGSDLNDGQTPEPEQLEILYWFADFPNAPQRFLYDEAQREADGEYLTGLIEEIKSLTDEEFELTSDEKRCRHCPYRSLCGRGVRAGAFEETGEEAEPGDQLDIPLDLEQIPDVEY